LRETQTANQTEIARINTGYKKLGLATEQQRDTALSAVEQYKATVTGLSDQITHLEQTVRDLQSASIPQAEERLLTGPGTPAIHAPDTPLFLEPKKAIVVEQPFIVRAPEQPTPQLAPQRLGFDTPLAPAGPVDRGQLVGDFPSDFGARGIIDRSITLPTPAPPPPLPSISEKTTVAFTPQAQRFGTPEQPVSFTSPTTGQIKQALGVGTTGAREIRSRVEREASERARFRIRGVTPPTSFLGHVEPPSPEPYSEPPPVPQTEERMEQDESTRTKRPRTTSISEDIRGKRHRGEIERMPGGERVEQLPGEAKPLQEHPGIGDEGPRDICTRLMAEIKKLGADSTNSILKGRVGDMMRKLGKVTGQQRLTNLGNDVDSSATVSSELFQRIQDLVREICSSYLTEKQHAGTLKDKPTRGVEHFDTPIYKEPLAPHAKPRTVTPLVRRTGQRAGLPTVGLRPEAPPEGPVPFKLPFELTPQKPPKFNSPEHGNAWITYKHHFSEAGKHNTRDLMNNPETYKEYKEEVRKANRYAEAHNFEPFVPKLIKPEDKDEIQKQLQKMLDVIVSEQRTAEKYIDHKQNKQRLENVILERLTKRVARFTKEIEQARKAQTRAQTPDDKRRAQRTLDAKQRSRSIQEQKQKSQENVLSKINDSLRSYIQKNEALEHRKPFVRKSLKELQTAKLGSDFSGAQSSLQREHDTAPETPHGFQTPKPKHTMKQLRDAAQSGPRATGKKVEALRKKLLASENKHNSTRLRLEEFQKIPESPDKSRSKNDLEALLESYSSKSVIDRAGFDGLIHNIDRLLPQLHLKNIAAKNIRLSDETQLKLDNIWGLMRIQLQKSQLLDILEILQVHRGKVGTEFDQLKSLDTQDFRNKKAIKQKLREAESLHKAGKGFQTGKGTLLKLLKPSKRQKKVRKKPSKAKAKEVTFAERPGPFRL